MQRKVRAAVAAVVAGEEEQARVSVLVVAARAACLVAAVQAPVDLVRVVEEDRAQQVRLEVFGKVVAAVQGAPVVVWEPVAEQVVEMVQAAALAPAEELAAAAVLVEGVPGLAAVRGLVAALAAVVESASAEQAAAAVSLAEAEKRLRVSGSLHRRFSEAPL